MAKGPGLYSDIGKKARDLLFKDYNTDQKFTLTTYSPNGVAITTSSTKKGEVFVVDVNTQLKHKNVTTDVKRKHSSFCIFHHFRMVKGRQGECIRLYVRGTVLGYKRSKSNQYPNTSLVQIEGVNTKEEVAWYAGKWLAYIYKAKVKRDGSHYRCIWGKVTRPHGNSGVVRAKFTSNLPPKSTTTVTEKREDEATSKPCSREPTTTTHKWNRSPSRKRPVVADANVSGGNERRIKSPARRPSPSLEKKMKNGSRLVRGRESGSVANRKVNAGPTGVRRDSGEGSGRRSRSPSCSRTVGVSSKIGVGVGRKQAPAKKSESEEVGEINDIVCNVTEKKSESEEGGEKNDIVCSEEGGEKNDIVCSEEGGEKNDIVCSEEVGEKNDIVSQVESIENPHVSMECFIFL